MGNDASGGGYVLTLADVLNQQEGFEALMGFLVKEFSSENLMCFVELSQYINMWQPMDVMSPSSDDHAPPSLLSEKLMNLQFDYFEMPNDHFKDDLDQYTFID